ncbi:hypothetical protein GOBAR_DD26883 [Gossypium barbadense]|nr:hypothetical protein GOBAR_DD26883 [Gossypium barbadense]
MITRSNLADQLREYQLRSKHDWASVSFFASTSNLTTSSSHQALRRFLKLLSPFEAPMWTKFVGLIDYHLNLTGICHGDCFQAWQEG